MRIASMIVLFLAVPYAIGAEPRLNKDMAATVQGGVGKMTIEEVLKAIPGPVKAEHSGDGDANWTLKWEEVTFIAVSLVDGKVESAMAEFNDTVVSKRLTFDSLKQIKIGMKQSDVESTLGSANSTSSVRDDLGQTRMKCRWSQGRRVLAYIKDGKVTGGGYMEGQLP